MNTSTVGRSVELTRLGLGASQFGNLYREVTDAECRAVVDAAWDAGIRYFDTAPHYGLGLSERRLGELLRERPRGDFVISSKVGRLLVPTPHDAHLTDEHFVVPATHRRELDYSADGVRRSLDASLERLGLDRIDVVYVHDPDEFVEQVVIETLPALARLRDEGVVGAIGAGMNYSAPLSRFVRECDIDVVMVAGRLTLLDQSAANDLLSAAHEHGVGVVAAGVYNSGLLSSPQVRADAHYDYGIASTALIERARTIAAVCERHGVTLPDVAMAFPWRYDSVVSVVMGARTDAQVIGNVERAEAAVPDALWSELEAARLIPRLG